MKNAIALMLAFLAGITFVLVANRVIGHHYAVKFAPDEFMMSCLINKFQSSQMTSFKINKIDDQYTIISGSFLSEFAPSKISIMFRTSDYRLPSGSKVGDQIFVQDISPASGELPSCQDHLL